MMGLSSIRAASRSQAQKSATRHRRPLLVESDDLINKEVLRAHLKKVPNLGDYVPAGYAELKVRDLIPTLRYDEFFVSLVDEGSHRGPALSQDEFVNYVLLLGPGYAYSISEIGQFQCHVRLFKKV